MPPPPPPGPAGWGQAPGTPPAPSAPPPFGQPAYGQPAFGQPSYGYQIDPMAPPSGYAGFWQRLGGNIIDGLFGLLFYLPAIALVLASFAASHDGRCTDVNGFESTCRQPSWPLFFLGLLLGFAGVIALAIYLCRRLGRTGQTPGRKVMGIKVVDKNTGQPIGTGRALGRYLFAGFISGQVCYLGYLWALWEGQKRTWHDMVVGSIVVRA